MRRRTWLIERSVSLHSGVAGWQQVGTLRAATLTDALIALKAWGLAEKYESKGKVRLVDSTGVRVVPVTIKHEVRKTVTFEAE